MPRTAARELGLTPLARVVATSIAGVAPDIMGVGPIEAVPKLLAATGLTMADISVVELNEAFASQVLACVDDLGISIEDQLNPNGGAIALGHPPGMTGARIMTTLINDLQTLDGTIGLETMCVGGGQGMAALVERLSLSGPLKGPGGANPLVGSTSYARSPTAACRAWWASRSRPRGGVVHACLGPAPSSPRPTATCTPQR